MNVSLLLIHEELSHWAELNTESHRGVPWKSGEQSQRARWLFIGSNIRIFFCSMLVRLLTLLSFPLPLLPLGLHFKPSYFLISGKISLLPLLALSIKVNFMSSSLLWDMISEMAEMLPALQEIFLELLNEPYTPGLDLRALVWQT